MKNFKMSKLWKVSLALLISLTSIGTLVNSVDLLASEEFDVSETVTLNDEKTQATITLDIDNINENYSIQSIENPEGAMMDIAVNPSYVVDKNGTYTFKINYVDNSSEEEEVLVYEKEVTVTQFETKKEEKQTRAVSNSSGDNLTVEFMRDSGSNIDWSDTAQLDWNYYDEEKIEITSVFSEKGITKTREIYVDIPDGYRIVGYSAKTGTTSQNGEVILTTTDEVQQVMKSSTLTSQNGGVFGSEQLTGYMSNNNTAFTDSKKSGKIKYEFNSEADVVVLTIRLGIDTKLSTFEDTRTLYSDVLGTTSVGISTGQLLNDLKVEMVSGSETLEESVKANVKQTVTTLNAAGSGTTTTYIDDDNYSTVIPAFSNSLQIYNYGVHRVNMVFDEVVMTYTYPEGAIFTGMSSPTSAFIEATGATFVHDETNRVIIVTYKKFQTGGGAGTIYQPTFKLDGDFYGLSDGKKKSVVFNATTAFKFIGTDNYIVDKNRSQVVTLVNKNQPLKLTGYNQKTYDYYANGYDGYQYLGNHSIENPAFVDNENAEFEWEFTDGLGVKIVRFGMIKDTAITDVTVYTTNHPTGISIADMKVTGSAGEGAIIDADILGLEENDYIIKVTGEIDKIAANTGRGTEWATKMYGCAAYGVILNGSGGINKLTVDGVTSAAITETTSERYSSVGGVKTNAFETAYYPGDKIPVSLTYTMSSDSYNRSKIVTDDFLQDPTIYIRVPTGFSLDENSVSFDYLGDVNDLITMTGKITADDGSLIYKYEFNKEYSAVIGRLWKGGTGSYSTVNPFNVSFDLIVSPTNRGTANLPLQDFVMIEGKGDFVGYDGTSRYIRNDDFELTSSGNNLLVPDDSVTISVIKLSELQVSSGIRVKDSGDDYYIYNGNDSSIAGLSRTKSAEVEVSYYNNAQSAFERASIYFPIPKVGKDYGSYFNNKAISDPINKPEPSPFTWSVNLTGEITVPGFTTLYATDGAINTSTNDGSLSWEAFEPETGWKTYTQVSDKLDSVIFLKFVSNNQIDSGDGGSFSFELKAATDSPVDEVNYWRTYSSAQPLGTMKQSWVVGSVLAGSLSVGEISGLVFYDNNANGKYDTGDTLYNGSELTINLSEKDGKISTTTLAIGSDSTYSIERLKEGEYSISVINTNTTDYHFSKTTVSTDTVVGSNVTANAAHSEGKYTGMVIKAGDTETYENVGIGLISKLDTNYEFEDRVMGDTSLSGKAKLTISGSQIEYDGTLVNNTFPQETFSTTSTVNLPDGMVHLGWQLYSVDSSTLKKKIGNVILPADLKDTAVPTVDSGSSLLVKAVVSYGPTVTTSDLTKYVGDNVNLLDGITAATESSETITLVTGLLGNTEVTQSIPVTDNNEYKTAGTYEVTYKVKDLTTGSYTTAKRLVKVHEAPTVSATPQEYTLGDASIMTNVLGNPSATWKEAQPTVGDATIQTINGPAITTDAVNTIKAEISGPSSDFSVTGIHTVTYIATDVNGKTGSKTVDVLIKSDTYTPDPTGIIGIDADYFVLENAAAKNLTATTAKSDVNGNTTAFTKTFDESTVQIGYATINRDDISVDNTQLKAINAVGVKGGIFNLTYSVAKDSKNAEITVKVFVKPVNYEESDDESLIITANGFAINYEDASAFDDAQATTLGLPVAYKITKDAQGKITDIETVTPISVNATHISDIQGAPKTGGTYDLEYSVSDGSEVASITVEVLVRPKDSVEDEDLSITAFGFILENSEASLLDQDDANTRGNSIAYKTVYTDGEVSSYTNISDKITVNSDDLAKINKAGEKGGIFDLTYTIKDGNNTKTKTVEVLVKPLNSDESPDGRLIISANGFAINYEDAKGFDDTQASTLALPVAYKITVDSDGDITSIAEFTPIEVNATHISDIQGAPFTGGIYDLEYYVSDGSEVVSTTVRVLVRPKNPINDEDLSISAFGFILENSEASLLDQGDANTRGNSIAYRTEYINNVISDYINISDKITVDEKELDAIKNAGAAGGIFDLTYTIKDGKNTQSKTVQVLVKPLDSVSDSSESVVIYAKGFTLEHEEAIALNDAEANSKAYTIAYGITYDEDGIITDIQDITSKITIDATQLSNIQNALTAGGIFDLTFSVTNGTNSVSIEVPVLVNPKYMKEKSNIVLGAEGFSLKNEDAASLDAETAILSGFGNVSAYKYVYDANGNLIGYSDITSKITVDAKELEAINNAPAEGGIYDLTFYVTDTVMIDGKEVEVTVEKTVKVTVEGTSTPPVVELPDGDNLAITAKDFTVENADAAGVDKSTAIALSEAEAWLLKKGTQVDVSVDEAMLKEIQNAPANGGVYDLTFFATYTPLTRAEEAYTLETTIKVTVLPLDEKKPSTAPTTPTTSNPSVAGSGTNTGDTTNLNMYIGLAFISLLVIVGRKLKKEK